MHLIGIHRFQNVKRKCGEDLVWSLHETGFKNRIKKRCKRSKPT